MTSRELDTLVLTLLGLLGCDEESAWIAERIVRLAVTSLRRPAITMIAERIGVTQRTLARRLERAGLPTARALVTWGRLLNTLDAYGPRGVSLEVAASATDGLAAARVSRLVTEHAGITCGGWKRSGASLDALLIGFVQTHHARRRRRGSSVASRQSRARSRK